MHQFNFIAIDFPDRTIVNAYLNPEVNESRGKFSWVAPDTTALQDYLNAKIGWNLKTFQQVVLPVLGRFNSKEVTMIRCMHEFQGREMS